jgi:MerR family mercuric resistance operon transcriptional regulator
MSMEPRCTIGQLGRAAGVPASTVRFYERSRLLRPEGRTDGNYRVYGPASLERLRFIRAAQANGFALQDITALLNVRDGTIAPCKEVQILIEERLTDLDIRVEQLRHVQDILRASLKACRGAERLDRCQVIDSLKVASSSAPIRGSRRARPK